MPSSRAGMLRHVLTIQTVTPATNTFGERTETWASTTTRRGRIEPTGGGESIQSGKTEASATHVGVMRYYALTPQHRITWDGRTFGIVHAEYDHDRKTETRFLAREIK